MSGGRLNAIELRLHRLHGQVRQVMLDALAEAKAPGANEAAPMLAEARGFALAVKLQPILGDLELLRRELKMIGDTLDFRERLALRVPREFRYRARQSVASGRHRHGEVFQLLNEIVDDLRALWGGRGPSERELMDAVADAVKSGIEFQQGLTSKMHEFRAVLESGRDPSVGPARTVQNVSFEGLVLLAWLIAYALLRRKP